MPKILDYSKPRCPGCMSTLLSAHPRNENVVHCNTCDLVSHVNKLVYLKREERKKPAGTGKKVGPRYVPETGPLSGYDIHALERLAMLTRNHG